MIAVERLLSSGSTRCTRPASERTAAEINVHDPRSPHGTRRRAGRSRRPRSRDAAVTGRCARRAGAEFGRRRVLLAS